MEVSEEKANQRVEEFKREMKTLTVRLKEAENRAESAEKQVKRLQKEVDRLEGKFYLYYFKFECYVMQNVLNAMNPEWLLTIDFFATEALIFIR